MKKLLAAILLFMTLTVSAQERKSVVVISPYKISDAWSKSSISPVTDLGALHPEMDVDHFTLDISVYRTEEAVNDFISNVINRYNGKRPDLLMIVGSQSYGIIEDFNKVWPGIPMILSGEVDYVCDRNHTFSKHPDSKAHRTPLQSLVPKYNLTLVQTPVYCRETMDMMCAMLPKLSEVLFIGGEDYYSREEQVEMEKVVRSRGLKFTAVTPFDMSVDEFFKMAEARDREHTAFLFKSCYVANDRTWYRADIENHIPVFLMHYMEFKGDHGALGYVSYKFRNYRETLQNTISSALFDGVAPKDIPFNVIKSEPAVVNVDCVAHYGLNRKYIPKDAKQINVPPTFWETYRNAILLLALLLFVIAVISALLVSVQDKRKRLQKATEELEAANRSLSIARDNAVHLSELRKMYVQNMGHDVRTPVNAIVGFSQLLGLPEGYVTEQEKEEYADYINSNAEMLMLLVDDILDMSDLENNGYKVFMQDTPCNRIAEVSVSCAKSRAQAGVRMYCTTEVADDYTVRIDPRRAQQILVNYLTNACKHTRKGEIHVHCSISEEPGHVVFSVADTGSGIDPAMAETIFKRYTKLDDIEGHGIGLNICAALARKMGCEVRLDTSYSGGARFILSIPITQNSNQ